jgi:hypothetical protein
MSHFLVTDAPLGCLCVRAHLSLPVGNGEAWANMQQGPTNGLRYLHGGLEFFLEPGEMHSPLWPSVLAYGFGCFLESFIVLNVLVDIK